MMKHDENRAKNRKAGKAGKMLVLLMLAAVLCMALTACGDTSKESNSAQSSADSAHSSADTEYLEYKDETGLYGLLADGDAASGTVQKEQPVQVGENTRKLVTTVTLQMESTAFDECVKTLEEQTGALGGYVEYAATDGEKEQFSRSASYTLRIPTENRERFLQQAGTVANILSSSARTEDVTLSYVDTESRIKALRAEQESLLALLERADSVESIMSVQSALSDVNYQLESYESTLRTMENQVAYDTVEVYLQEVQRESAKEETGVWARIRTDLGENLYQIVQGVQNAFVFVIAGLPYLVLFAVAVMLVVLLVRALLRRGKKGKHKQAAQEPQAPKQDAQ